MTLYNLFPAVGTTLPTNEANDNDALSLGTEFYVTDAGCTVTKIRWYCPVNSANVLGREGAVYSIYEPTHTLTIETEIATFPTASPGAWCEIALVTPLILEPLVRYRVAVFHPAGRYPATGAYFVEFGEGDTNLVQGPVVRPSAAGAYGGTFQGTYAYGPELGPPMDTFNGASYFSDVEIAFEEGDGAVTLSPSSIASAEAFGTATAVATLTAAPTGIASAEAFGTPAASTDLTASPEGIASDETFGTPASSGSLTASPASITSAEAFGTPSASASLTASPSGIASAEAFGTPSASGASVASPAGIASGEAFGSPVISVTLTVSPIGIGTSEAFGSPVATRHVLATATAIASLEVFGSPSASGAITPSQGRDYAGSIPRSRYSGAYSNHRWDGSLG